MNENSQENHVPWEETGLEIAVIGMAGRFPGAAHIGQFWNNLKNGIDSISFFNDNELLKSGIDPAVIKSPDYVKAKGYLEDIEYFDASFFDFQPAEAEILDPQTRIFLECVWEALEDAGYPPGVYNGLIGLYAGASVNNNWLLYAASLTANEPDRRFSAPQLVDKDFLTTHVSYKLNLRGPSSTIFTACSTSLVAIHQACQGLISGECQVALAGGVSVSLPLKGGYLYKEGMIFSPHGHCRAFDREANGIVFGNGAGVVVLKQLEKAKKNRDHIYAIVKGSAVNNDGNQKVGFTAPGINGQVDVIRAAHQASEVEPGSIGYLEAHGTGTTMGDPIEIKALTRAFRTEKKGYCPIGSVKTNLGHLDIAAGAASFIKAVLMLTHKLIPPSLFFQAPNPEIDFENSPFYVNKELKEWKNGKYPRRAGVSSFGIGGTNAHVILEEWPLHLSAGAGDREQRPSREHYLLLLSAKTQSALDRAADNLAGFLRGNPGINLADVEYTLQVGRSSMEYRKFVVCQDVSRAAETLSTPGPEMTHRLARNNSSKAIVFMFPGQGSQYVDMGLELYRTEPVFRRETDRCFEILTGLSDTNIKEILYPGIPGSEEIFPGGNSTAANNTNQSIAGSQHRPTDINQTEIAQPAIFIIGYALAKLFMHWGIYPDMMVGHSIGEYTAACLAGVFSLEDALRLVVSRGKIMQRMPTGAMVSVQLSEEELKPLLEGEIALAAVNGPMFCVVSGTHRAIDAFEKKLNRQAVQTTRLHTSHAFHSPLMDPVKNEFREKFSQVRLQKPEIPFISNVTGGWLSDEDAVSPDYWASQLRETVRFYDGMKELLKEENAIFLELGPGQALTTLARKQAKQANSKGNPANQQMINLMRHPQEQVPDYAYLLNKIGQLWLYGSPIDVKAFYSREKRYRLALPTYPFERQRYWAVIENPGEKTQPLQKKSLNQWFYVPTWKRSTLNEPGFIINDVNLKNKKRNCCLVFTDSVGLGSQLVERMEKENRDVISVRMGPMFEKAGPNGYTVNPLNSQDYVDLFNELETSKRLPGVIVHLWNITGDESKHSLLQGLDNILENGFYSLLVIAQVVGKMSLDSDLRLWVVTNNMQEVVGGELLSPVKAAALGPALVLNREYPHISCRSIDVILPPLGTETVRLVSDQLLSEILDESPANDLMIAYRGLHRWVRNFEAVQLKESPNKIPRLREKGVYLVTGGLGGIGLVLAKHLAAAIHARLILIGRSSFPHKSHWDQWVKEHEEKDPVSIKIKHLQELEALGAEVMTFSADVTEPDRMQAAISRAREQFGAINGVIHAAGVTDGALIQLQTRQKSGKVLAPKIKGTLVLHEVLQNESLDFFMLCSSILSALGPMGQAGYCAANAFLDAFAFYNTRSSGTFTQSVNWDIWQEVGMAVNVNRPTVEYKKINHFLYDKYIKVMGEGNPGVFIANLSVSKHWFLDEHRVMGSAIVLGTVYLEMARAAFELHVGQGPVEIRNVYYLNPLLVGDKENKEVRVILKKQGKHYEFSFITRANVGKKDWILHARGEIQALPLEAESTEKEDIEEFKTRFNLTGDFSDTRGRKFFEGGFLAVGPRWSCLLEMKGSEQQGAAKLKLPEEYAGDLETYRLHPALLDVAASFAAETIDVPGKSPALPFSYKRLRMLKPIPGRMFVHSQYLDHLPGDDYLLNLTLNILIMDEAGNKCVEVEEFTLLTVLNDGKPIAQKVREKFPLPSYVRALNQEPGQSTGGLPENFVNMGILPSEGKEVFNRVLGSSMPQVLVSTRVFKDIYGLVDSHTRQDARKAAGQEVLTDVARGRPDLGSIYVAPEDETEKKLAQVLENYLGIEKIGIHDNFFELGATSLDFAQVVDRLEKAVNKEIPIVAMFSYPTISDLRSYLEQEERTLKFSTEEIERLEKKDNKKNKKKMKLKKKKDKRRKKGANHE